MKFKRVFCIVMDSVGIGAEPDAAAYGDAGTNTIVHIANFRNGLKMPNMEKLGYGNLEDIKGVNKNNKPMGYYTKAMEVSKGKDTLTGHWEIMGVKVETPFKTFTETGFPDDLIHELETRTGHKVIGNKSASGTEIIKELGMEEIKNGKMIVYTSGDSVLQICGNEETFGLDELYRCCEIAREITMKPEWMVGRVIARPYVGDSPENFKRTSNRHDYAVDPFEKTVLDTLHANGTRVISIGKISDIFNGNGIDEGHHTTSNVDGMEQTIAICQDKDFKEGLCFVNLVDFDALWGHRRNPDGYATELETFDKCLGDLLKVLRDDDLVILTADHGNDPTHTGTDHTREMVPVIFYSPSLKTPKELPLFETFANIGATIADNFNVELPKIGKSYLDELN